MKEITTLVLHFVILINIAGVIVGCSTPKPDVNKSWVSVEKPPIKIVYMNDADKIDDYTVSMLLRYAEHFPYKNYKFNESNGIYAHSSSYKSEIEEDSFSTVFNTGK